MLLKIAWRNIWRSKLRSLVVMLAICAGTWSVLMLVSFTQAFVDSYVNNMINKELGHIQIHNVKYADDPVLANSMANPDSLTRKIADMKDVKAVSYRTVINGMLNTGHGVRGITIAGVNPTTENKVLGYSDMIVAGTNVDTTMRNPILIGKDIAKDLQLGVGKKLVLTFQDKTGNMVSGAFRVSGLYKTNNKGFDDSHVFVRRSDLVPLTGMKNRAQEIVIRCASEAEVKPVAKMLRGDFPNLRVQDFEELAPEISLFKSQIQASSYLYIAIFMFALIFGIINTMLMAVLERVRELGMLMAVGLTRVQTFLMIVYETVFLALLAAPIGMLLGYFTILQMGKTGLDLSNWAQGMTQFGMATKIFPSLESNMYWEIGLAVAITALLASIYPAIKAIRLRPVEAIRKI